MLVQHKESKIQYIKINNFYRMYAHNNQFKNVIVEIISFTVLPKKKKTHLGLYLVKMFKTNMEKEHT
jgi:isoprenylcysteine carboxyl methyltransferase (ICMT) family protein YpbQ